MCFQLNWTEILHSKTFLFSFIHHWINICWMKCKYLILTDGGQNNSLKSVTKVSFLPKVTQLLVGVWNKLSLRRAAKIFLIWDKLPFVRRRMQMTFKETHSYVLFKSLKKNARKTTEQNTNRIEKWGLPEQQGRRTRPFVFINTGTAGKNPPKNSTLCSGHRNTNLTNRRNRGSAQ